MNQNVEQQDERVLEERRNIQSKGYSLLVWGLLISLLVQQLMHAPFAQYAAEFWLLMGCSVYQMAANVRRGFNIWGGQPQRKGRPLLTAILAGMVAAWIMLLGAEGESWVNLAVFLVTFIPIFYGMQKLLAYLSQKKQEKIEQALDEEEDD